VPEAGAALLPPACPALAGSFFPSAPAQLCAEGTGRIQAAMNNELATREE